MLTGRVVTSVFESMLIIGKCCEQKKCHVLGGPRKITTLRKILQESFSEQDYKNLLHSLHTDFKWLFHITVAMLGERRVSETPKLRFSDEVSPPGGSSTQMADIA